MSWQATRWAAAQRAGSAPAKAVLLILAEAADAAGECYPSHATIAERAELAERSVWRAMGELEARGLISRHRRRDRRGWRTSDLIRLKLTSQPAPDAVREGPVQTAPAAARTDEVQTAPQAPPDRTSVIALTAPGAAEQVRREQVNEQSPLLPPPSEADFERWWTTYPRKVEKKAARERFAAILSRGEATAEELIAGAERYALSDTVARGYIKHPTTWLNRGCWTDESSAGVQHRPRDHVADALRALADEQ